MLKIDNANDLVVHLAPIAVECFEISARRKGPEPPTSPVTFNLDTTPAVRVRDGEGLDIRLTIRGDATAFDAKVDVAVMFNFTDEVEVSEEALEAFLAGRGTELAYPYAKEAFEHAIARIGFPAILPLMPIMNGQAAPANAPQD